MCFSLFRPKKPNKTTPNTPGHSSSRQTTPPTSTTVDPTITGNSSNSNNYYSSKSSSISSRTSLSSLKDSLPENPHIYDLSAIRAATNNFLLRPLSSSPTSTSWRATLLGNDVVITQRKLRHDSLDTAELRRQLSLICKFHHASLVKLRGAAVGPAGGIVYLVYEYIHGANLADCLRNPRNPNFTVLSNWLSRIQIVAGIADGIDYMHNCVGISGGYVHNHIKSTSIIVAEEPSLTAKICHFGTAQLCGELPESIDNSSGDEITDAKGLKRGGSAAGKFSGTRGYMSPEFQITGIPTLKSDVYAFGVVVLEILSGKEPLKVEMDQDRGVFRKVSLIETARDAAEGGEGRLRQWVDRRLRDSYPVDVAEGLARVALECVQEDAMKRPDMGKVAGWVSKLYLDSKTWAQNIGVPEDITASFAPR